MMEMVKDLSNGKAAAALIAGGIGIALTGILSTLSETIPAVRTGLTIDANSGALSGINIIPVILGVLIWFRLDSLWKDKNINFGKVMIASRILLGIGLLGTFPLFIRLFSGG